MFEKLKSFGAGAGAAMAVLAAMTAMISAFGGHVPPWATYAWATTIEQATTQNAVSIQQLNALFISQKVAELQARAAANPQDVFVQQELRYWTIQLKQAEDALLKRK